LDSLIRRLLPRVCYGALFIVVIPTLLTVWVRAASEIASPPMPCSLFWGFAIATLSLGLMSVAMATLWFRGGGLPMNAFPPPRFVSSGLYSLVPHPIYGGFVLACAGVSIMTGSGTG
jgi:protein-S-isoprenylcysteine O-methyltransferase Ste14